MLEERMKSSGDQQMFPQSTHLMSATAFLHPSKQNGTSGPTVSYISVLNQHFLFKRKPIFVYFQLPSPVFRVYKYLP